MKSENRSNALLVELLIVVMFFMLTSSILIQVFAAAHNQSSRAELITSAVSQAQDIADSLYAADDPKAVLDSFGFEDKDGIQTLETEKYRIEVSITEENESAGNFRRQELRVMVGDETLVTLPCSRWEGGAQ